MYDLIGDIHGYASALNPGRTTPAVKVYLYILTAVPEASLAA